MSEEKKLTERYRCEECDDPCEVRFGLNTDKPDGCPFRNDPLVTNWKRVEQDQPVTMKQEMECRNCRFYEPCGAGDICRRFPPTAHGLDESNFPRTGAGGWCGEFQAKKS